MRTKRGKRLTFSQTNGERLTHYLFRYPAKFHPPAVRALIERYSEPGDTVLDPFCGSGTCLVEATVLGRHSIGTDVDPLAIFLSRVKTHRVNVSALERSIDKFLLRMNKQERDEKEYERRQFEDISQSTFKRELARRKLRPPNIPNIQHWFRLYVVVDLCRLRRLISRMQIPSTHRDFLLLCFASTVRSCSNADPVPVSGLEVTAHMKAKDAEGRVINPFALLRRSISRSLKDMEEFVKRSEPTARARAAWADATELTRTIRSPVDAVITSPPYHNAVDYYRRHTLEMYWLNLVDSHDDRLAILPRYIGRDRVSTRHRFVTEVVNTPGLVDRWEKRIREESDTRANAFKHYMVSMRLSIEQIESLLAPSGKAIFVLGRSSWNGEQIPTTKLFEELCSGVLELQESYWYPLKNRYMSYSRHNGANIDKEFVLVLKKPNKQRINKRRQS